MTHRYVRHSVIGFILWPKGPGDLSHDDMRGLLDYGDGQITSAGMVRFEQGLPVCYGRSVSLSLSAEPDDAEDLAEELGLGEFTTGD
jgi:hypothetical protein